MNGETLKVPQKDNTGEAVLQLVCRQYWDYGNRVWRDHRELSFIIYSGHTGLTRWGVILRLSGMGGHDW